MSEQRRACARRGVVGLVAPLMILTVGCGAAPQEPTAPGPPPTGAPGTLVLPRSFGIAQGSSALAGTSGVSADGIDYAAAVAEGAGLAAETEELLAFLMSPFERLKIPVGSTATSYQSTLTISNGSGSSSVTLAAAIDFADFDLDGDGAKEGCSGHTAALPICLRIWLDGERFLAGRLDAFPGDDSPGAGRLTVRKTTTMPGGEDGMGVTVIFDHQAPDNTSSEVFWGIPSNETGSTEIVAVRHVLLTQSGEATTALRTLNLSDRMDVPGDNTLRYVVRYRVGGALWSGSVEATGIFGSMLGLQSFPVTCVELQGGNKVDDGQCETLGISAASVSSLALADAATVALPADFPASPTP